MDTIRTPGRRAILAGAAATLCAAAAARAQGAETPVKYSSGTAPPRLRLPANATDCHHHVYNAQGEFRWSSQQLDGGRCDGHSEAAIGLGTAGRDPLAWRAGRVTA